MKRCPECGREYDNSMMFCLDDGAELLYGPALTDGLATALLSGPPGSAGNLARPTDESESKTAILQPSARTGASDPLVPRGFDKRLLAASCVVAVIVLGGFFGYRYFAPANSKQIESVAVMPFSNETGNADIEYLSDGMTETLITSLSQLPNLSVKARSSVFRYKGRETDTQTVGRELNVQAVLNGSVFQRGSEVASHIELIDVETESVLWSADYSQPMANLFTLQRDIARDVSGKLRTKLSGKEAENLAKNYTENVEAYQLYLKGRYHFARITPAEMRTGIAYFQQAIAVDPTYALAYVGLADAYRSLVLAADERPNDVLPKAKAAAEKAVEIDDHLAEAHAMLGFIKLWYDWNWKESEDHLAKALKLNPNSADIQMIYAHQLSVSGRHEEALSVIRRAKDLEPLNLRIGSLEGQFLIHAGKPDVAISQLRKISELDPNFWLAHLFMASGYIDREMYSEAVPEARKAFELSSMSTQAIAFGGYALAKAGRRADARAALEQLLELSQRRYVPPYNIALVYWGLADREEAFKWLERAFEERDTRMIFLKAELKWNNLHADPRFQSLLQRVGLHTRIAD